MSKLTHREITLITEYYIGVEGGYLGNFSDRRTLQEFYQVDCDLDINPSYEYEGTIREEFVEILKSQSTRGQSIILRTVLHNFHCESAWKESQTRQEKLRPRLEVVARRLEDASEMVSVASSTSLSDAVALALEDAEHSIRRGHVPSAVDRTHTALHGYMKDLCNDWIIEFERDASLTKLFKLLRKEHPAFFAQGPRHHDIDKMLNGLATTLDALNTIRNHASLAHPQIRLLAEAEATLAINAARSIFLYAETVTQELYDEMKSCQSAGTSSPDSNPFDDAATVSIDDIPF